MRIPGKQECLGWGGLAWNALIHPVGIRCLPASPYNVRAVIWVRPSTDHISSRLIPFRIPGWAIEPRLSHSGRGSISRLRVDSRISVGCRRPSTVVPSHPFRDENTLNYGLPPAAQEANSPPLGSRPCHKFCLDNSLGFIKHLLTDTSAKVCIAARNPSNPLLGLQVQPEMK